MFDDVFAVKRAILHGFRDLRILVVGDLMLDEYQWGTAARISPEAPVPVVKLKRRSVALGGAANVAANLRSLGVRVDLAGVVGLDEQGTILGQECAQMGIGMAGVIGDARRKTTTKARIIADGRQVLRVDDEEVSDVKPRETNRVVSAITKSLETSRYGAVILSDYAKGFCTPDFCEKLIALCAQVEIPVFVDPKGRNFGKYAGVRAIKPNREELEIVARENGWSVDATAAASELRDWLGLDFVAATLGAEGAVVIDESGTHRISTAAQEVFDVSGAGDTVMAVLVAGLLSGLGLMDSLRLGNLAAGLVIAHTGTSPIGPEQLLTAVQARDRKTGTRKLYDVGELKMLVEAWQARGLKVAITNGCFDLIHAGHVRLLEEAAAQADKLIVALNSDDSITRLKGPERPIMPWDQRVGVLSALESIDAVVVFDEDTPEQLICALRPDVLIKGGDYRPDQIVGAEFVRSYGGRVFVAPLVHGLSTSNLEEAIRKL